MKNPKNWCWYLPKTKHKPKSQNTVSATDRRIFLFTYKKKTPYETFSCIKAASTIVYKLFQRKLGWLEEYKSGKTSVEANIAKG